MTVMMVRDDMNSLLEVYDVEDGLKDLAEYLPTIDRLKYFLDEFCADRPDLKMAGFSTAMVEQLVADLVLAGKLVGSDIAEGSNVEGIERAAAPSGVGINAENVWVTPPGETYTLRFYVNGELKETYNDYYITSLESLGAESGDTIQICQVVVDEVTGVVTVGWMTSAATVAGAVLDEALGEHAGFLTGLLTAAGYTAPANSDIATILSRITAERAGYLDAAISSRLAASGYTAPDNDSIASILADTGELQENQSNWLTANLTTLESRLSAVRAGYLDLLNTYLDAPVSGAVAPTVDEINTKLETEHGAGSWGAQGAYTITPTTPLTDSVSGDPISGMTVKIYSNALRTETYLITEVTSDTEGSFTAHVTASGTYYLRAIKEGYTTIEWTEVAA